MAYLFVGPPYVGNMGALISELRGVQGETRVQLGPQDTELVEGKDIESTISIDEISILALRQPEKPF